MHPRFSTSNRRDGATTYHLFLALLFVATFAGTLQFISFERAAISRNSVIPEGFHVIPPKTGDNYPLPEDELPTKQSQQPPAKTQPSQQTKSFLNPDVLPDLPPSKREEPVRIVSPFGTTWLVEGWPIPNCSVPCYFDRNANSFERTSSADAVIFGFREDPAQYQHPNPNLIKIFFASESDSIYTAQRDHYKKVEKQYGLTVTYHMPNDEIIQNEKKNGKQWIHLPISYSPKRTAEYFKDTWVKSKKRTDALASIFVSNCGVVTSSRNHWIKELINEIGVASFGNCHNNRRVEDVNCGHNDYAERYDQKLCAISQYKFYLAFENSVDESYVTEKYWQALLAGVVPVYLGAENIEFFSPSYGVPNEKSIIQVSDFDSPKELGDYLKRLANDDKEYNKYLEWRKRPPTPHFAELTMQSLDHAETACFMCETVAKLKYSKELKN